MGSKAVAGAVREGVKQVYWVADGAEGPRGWKVLRTSADVCTCKCFASIAGASKQKAAWIAKFSACSCSIIRRP